MTIETGLAVMPAHWACYLINGDASGITEADAAACDAFIEANRFRVVDVACDADGVPDGPWFTWSYSLYGGECQGGDVQEYVVQMWGDE